MKTSVNALELRAALKEIEVLARKKHTVNILASVLLIVENGKLLLYGTDYDQNLHTEVNAGRGECESGSACVNATKLLKSLAAFGKNDTVELQAEAEKNVHTIKVRGGTFQVKLPGIPPEDYPEFRTSIEDFQRSKKWQIPTATLRELLDRGTYCMSTDESRMNLTGAHFDVACGERVTLRVTATDGHRLASVMRSIASGGADEIDAIASRVGVETLKRVVKAADKIGGIPFVSLSVDKAFLSFCVGGTILQIRTIEDTYPDWHKVVPKSKKLVATVDRAALGAMVSRMAKVIVENGKHGGVVIDREHEHAPVCVSMENAGDQLRVSDTLEDCSLGAGNKAALYMNFRYILDALAALGDDTFVKLSAKDAFAPVSFDTPGAVENENIHIVMPMRR